MKFESTNTESINTQYHYVGKSSLYKFSEEWDLNSYEFDIVKRIVRCRKKGISKISYFCLFMLFRGGHCNYSLVIYY